MSTASNKALVRRFYEEVINQGNFHIIEELVGENFKDHNPEPGQPAGRDGIAPMFQQFHTAFPDLTMRVETLVADGDRVGALVVMSGTHLGTFAETPATGRTIEMSGFDWCRIDNGRIVERWGVFDMAGMMQQLGLTPGPSTDDLKKLSRRYYELLDAGRGDLATIRNELFHEQHVTHFPGQPQPLTSEGLQQLSQGFWKAFPDISHKVTSQLCEGDTVLNHLTFTATHKGEFAGVPATNKSVELDAMTSHRWIDGKLQEQHVHLDMVALLQQIGAIPA